MKLCFSTLPCGEINAKQIMLICKRHSICSVELRLDTDNSIFGTKDLEKLRTIGNLFQNENIIVPSLGTSVCLLGYDNKKVETAIYCGKMANSLKAKGIRIFLGNFRTRYDKEPNPIDYDGIVKAIQEMCDTIETNVLIETHNEFATGAVLEKLLATVKRDNVKIIWDAIHSIEDKESIEDTWRLIGDKIVHFHLKDGEQWDDPIYHDWKYTRLGYGKMPNKEIIQLLNKNNYNGYISLEWENAWRNELKAFPTDIDWILNEYIEYMARL